MHQSQYLQIQTCCIMRISRQSKIGFGELSSFRVPHLSWHQGKAQLRMRKTPSALLLFATSVEAVLIRAVWEQKGIKVCFLLGFFVALVKVTPAKGSRSSSGINLNTFQRQTSVSILSYGNTPMDVTHAINANDRLTLTHVLISKYRKNKNSTQT